ncbi:bifunctional 3-deoxy-7-phosphoheptulonate synthase/chorismate mutase type II [Planomonospora sp. ID91781]|nr:bifunctional 3-deoxy-7-phosphoheptulonate synthase/chorismate mutase type II [Planomonospora sp. ID91781]
MSLTVQPTERAERGAVRLGTLTLGAGPAVVIGGPGADARWIDLRERRGRPAGGTADALAEVRACWAGPVLVEPSSADDLPGIAAGADGVVVGAAWTRDLRLVRAVSRLGLPVVVQRGPATSLEEWLAVADYCAADAGDRVVLCEGGGRGRAGSPAAPPDLALMRGARERSGRPVLAGLGDDPALAAAAVAAGADGLLLSPDPSRRTTAAAQEAVRVVGALTRREEPGSVPAARGAIDRVDAALAVLLERRAELAGTVQRLKPVGGFAGRDMERERRLVAEMARRAPSLGEARLAPIMNAVIEAGLHLAEERRAGESRGGTVPPAGERVADGLRERAPGSGEGRAGSTPRPGERA